MKNTSDLEECLEEVAELERNINQDKAKQHHFT
jgi:hypothetical protein